MLLAGAEDMMFNSVQPENMRWTAPEFVTPDLVLIDSQEDSEILLPLQKPTKAGDIYSFGCVMLQVRWIVMISRTEPGIPNIV
jgi:hypothetical protein